MLELYQKIKSLREQQNMSQDELAKRTGYTSRTSIAKIEAGKIDLPQSKIALFAFLLDTTVAYLMGWEEETNKTKAPPALTKKDERDIEKILAAAREQLENQEGLMFDGDPASPEAIESILSAMELGLQAAKMRNKEKYTPKKYRQK